MSPLAEMLTRWTVRLALLCYFFAMHLRFTGGALRTHDRHARAVYTLGCVLMFAHVAAAFHFYHGWSHARAAADTDRQTLETTGLAFAGGIWFNYLFLALWLADAAHWWRGLDAHRRRSRGIDAALHAILLFILFNATVVFETGIVRWLGAVGCVWVAALAVRGVRMRGEGTATEGTPRKR